MAAATQSTQTAEDVGAQNLAGARLKRFRFSSISDTNTFASGINSVVAYAVFSGAKAIYATHSAGTFTFTVTSGPATDAILYVWSLDY